MTTTLPDPEVLRSRLASAQAVYEATKTSCENEVRRWVWATGPVLSLRPDVDARIHGMTVGKILAKAPAKAAGHTEYGLDAHERVVVSRTYNDLGHFTETFFAYPSDSLVEEWSYGNHIQFNDVKGVARYDYRDGHLVAYAQLRPDGLTAEAHEWQDGRLVRLHRRSKNPDIELSYTLEYDGAGDLSSVSMERPGGIRGVVYSAPKKSGPALARSVRARLLKNIPKAVGDLRASEPAFCLALVYDPASLLSMLPPNLAVGFESERRTWLESSGDGKRKAPIESLWDPQGFRTFDSPELHLSDKALLSETRQLAEHFRSEQAEGKAHDLLIEICKALNKVRWSEHIRVTPDFIVYPADLEMVHLREDVRLAVPARLVAALKRSGML